MADTEDTLKPLQQDKNEWYDSSGNMILMCVADEFDENQTIAVPAVMVVSGLSLCRKHAKIILIDRMAGYSEKDVLTDVYHGSLFKGE